MTKDELANVNRIEVIDHTKDYDNGGGRAYVKWEDGIEVTQQLQDSGRTLKIFINYPVWRGDPLAEPVEEVAPHSSKLPESILEKIRLVEEHLDLESKEWVYKGLRESIASALLLQQQAHEKALSQAVEKERERIVKLIREQTEVWFASQLMPLIRLKSPEDVHKYYTPEALKDTEQEKA